MFGTDEEDRELSQRLTRRALILGGLQGVGLSIVLARLYQVQIVEGPRLAAIADSNRTSTRWRLPVRGSIRDRAGRVLADSVVSYRSLIIPSASGDVTRVLKTYGELFDLDEDAQKSILRTIGRQPASLPATIEEDLSFERMAQISASLYRLPGIDFELVGKRRYVAGTSMGQIVGYVGAVSSHALDDDPDLRVPDARVGKTGIESGMDKHLRGAAGRVQHEVDARGRVRQLLDQTEPDRGGDVTLTIDSEVQQRVMERLSEHEPASAVVIDVASGEIAALASAPGYDPGILFDEGGQDDWERVRLDRKRPMFNRAIAGLYPPGSTFKMVTALAALSVGAIHRHEHVECSGTFEYFGQKFRCWNRSGHGRVNLHSALVRSCDVYFYEIAQRIGMEKMAAMAHRLGLGEPFDCGIAGVKRGLIPTPDWKLGRFNRPWVAGETVLAGIGQGYVSTTPLQLAVMTARLATGQAVVPRLAITGEGAASAPAPQIGLADTHLQAIRSAMHDVVHSRAGTGRQAAHGPDIAGKTGTSQVGSISSRVAIEELPWHLRDHSLFTGYFPSDKPKYAIAVVVEHGGSGGKVAAPLAADVAQIVMQPDVVTQPVAVETTRRRRS